MKKILSVVFFGLLMLNTCPIFAADNSDAAKEQSQYTYDVDDDFNFDDNSYYISDEQLKDIEDINKIEDETNFETKVINSSHFSSGTATRTYIPINKKK